MFKPIVYRLLRAGLVAAAAGGGLTAQQPELDSLRAVVGQLQQAVSAQVEGSR